MNTRCNTLVVLSAAAIIASCGLLIAGPLEPTPGPISPTMKTLHEVEPRIAIGPASTPGDADSVFRITQPGSYYLTGNVTGEAGKNGIEIACPNVSIDLNGFTLQGVAGSLYGIRAMAGGAANASVRNGVVSGWGGSGIDLMYLLTVECGVVEHVSASGNGLEGIRLASGGVMRHCTATDNGAAGLDGGLACVFEHCTAKSNGAGGIVASEGSTIIECTALYNTNAGISISVDGSILRCTSRRNTGDGIRISAGGHIEGCSSFKNDANGIVGGEACTIVGNTCHGNDENAGIRLTGGGNRVEKNNVTNNRWGIDADAMGNVIIANTAHANELAGFIAAGGNTVGPIVTGGTGAITNSNPWANFAY